MGYLTTHVLDTARGCPAAGLEIVLYRLEGGARVELARATTNADGRTDAPILGEEGFAPGRYELVFAAGAYLRASGQAGEQAGGRAREQAREQAGDQVGGQNGEAPLFLDEVPIRFGLAGDSHYHVPLLLSPFGYTTYRGS